MRSGTHCIQCGHDEEVFMATDPVCGMEVYEGTASGMMRYEGVTYYFCSKRCFGKFQDRPGAYLLEAA